MFVVSHTIRTLRQLCTRLRDPLIFDSTRNKKPTLWLARLLAVLWMPKKLLHRRVVFRGTCGPSHIMVRHGSHHGWVICQNPLVEAPT